MAPSRIGISAGTAIGLVVRQLREWPSTAFAGDALALALGDEQTAVDARKRAGK